MFDCPCKTQNYHLECHNLYSYQEFVYGYSFTRVLLTQHIISFTVYQIIEANLRDLCIAPLNDLEKNEWINLALNSITRLYRNIIFL
jgi:hypothetical protein